MFRQTGTKGVAIGTYAQVNAKDVVIRHSELAFNRRQGITVSGGQQILIEHNTRIQGCHRTRFYKLFKGAQVSRNTFANNLIFVEQYVNFSNNTLKDVYAKFIGPKVTTNVAMIKINEYGAANKNYDVKAVLIKSNRIITNLLVKGISTIDAGIGAPSYEISKNVLANVELELRDVDLAK